MSELSLEENKTENSRAEPIKVSWITNFKLVCLDRDILVVRECLTRASKPLAAALEDNTADHLELSWKSPAIIEVMKVLHDFSSDNGIPEISLGTEGIPIELEIMHFCFKYEIEPLLTNLKKKSLELMETRGSCGSWIKFFHDFKNADGTEVFKDQTIGLRLLAINNVNAIRAYFNNESINTPKDVIADYRFIISGLVIRLVKLESRSGLSEKMRASLQEIENLKLPY